MSTVFHNTFVEPKQVDKFDSGTRRDLTGAQHHFSMGGRKLVVTSATLLVTSALLVATRS